MTKKQNARKYEKLKHLSPNKRIFIEGYIKDFGHTIVLKIKGEKQKWQFDKKHFKEFYKLVN